MTRAALILCPLLACLAALSACDMDAGSVHIRAVSLLPLQDPYARDFAAWVDSVNERAQGSFKIILVGGPEALPTFEQADAVRTGVVHMVYGPATYYLGHLPEVEALFASNLPPWETRANGGVALMDRLHQQHMGVRYLARTNYIAFHVFTRSRPRSYPSGQPDLRDQRIRGGPVWRDFIASLGAVFVNIPAPDVYTALERGAIDGLGWPIVGIQDLSWDKHLHWRIDPGVFSSDVGIIFNAEKWQELSPDARKLLRAACIEYERDSYQRFQVLTQTADRELRANGMQVITLDTSAGEHYRRKAIDVIWHRIRARAPQNYQILRDKFYRD